MRPSLVVDASFTIKLILPNPEQARWFAEDMDRLEKQRFIRQKARENRDDPEGAKIFWSRHAIVEMINDKLTRTEVERALEQGQIIENYPI